MAHNLTFLDQLKLGAQTAFDSAADMINPTIRLGVTGLSRSGKTVFITSLIHQLLSQERLPQLKAKQSNRIKAVYIEPQPNDLIPTFNWQNHLDDLKGRARKWPSSTRHISQIRLVIEYETEHLIARHMGHSRLTIDIIDYPGEWLLDLPLMSKSFSQWSEEMLSKARQEARLSISAPWLDYLESLDLSQEWDEQTAAHCTSLYTNYLREGREAHFALSTLSPGRFLMPGDMEGSPALTFCPLPMLEQKPPQRSLYVEMERRYNAYKHQIIRPFYRDHFAMLDRQVILVDVVSALNAGYGAMQDLQDALEQILKSFKVGQSDIISSLFTRKIDMLTIAATKADHIHHSEHDKLIDIVKSLTQRAYGSNIADISIEYQAIAAIRSTKEAKMEEGGEQLPVLIGIAEKGEQLDGVLFDGETETAIFPGSLPACSDLVFKPEHETSEFGAEDYRFIKFRPPLLSEQKSYKSFPHIRMDNILEYLLGDKLA